MENIKLIPEQIEAIKKRLSELSVSADNAKTEIASREQRSLSSTCNQGFDYVPDFSSFYDLSHIRKEMKELRDILDIATIVTEYDSEKIGIGTRFTATLDFGDKNIITSEYVLVDGKYTYLSHKDSEIDYVTIDSPLGRACYKKAPNEVICYATPDKRIIGGLIDEISPSRSLDETLVESDKKYTK